MGMKIYIPAIDMTLDYLIDDYSQNNVYDMECNLSEKEFYSFRGFVIQKLEDGGYFECIVEEESKLVRFGVISHKKIGNGYFVEGPIVESSYDENESNKPVGNDFDLNIENQVLKTKIINDRLIEFLLSKGIMTEEEKTEILNVSKTEILEKYFDYNTL